MHEDAGRTGTAREAAARALQDGRAGDNLARDRGTLLDPIAIMSPEGARWGWMVPIALGERLLGLVQVTGAGAFHRYATFQRRPGDVASCPRLAVWLDADAVRARARRLAEPGEQLGEPVLTYHGSPDRLHWSVPATSTGGRRRAIAVAGDDAWVIADPGRTSTSLE